MIVRGAWSHFLRPGLRRDFRDSYMSYPEEYGMFLKVGNLARAEEERTAVSGLGRMVKKTEVGPISYIDPVASDKYVFVDEEYALGFMISRRMMEDDQYGRANQNAKWLGRSARLTQEYVAAGVLDDAFTGAIYTGLLGEKLIDDDHVLLNGSSTWSNEVPGNPPLSYTGYQAALELMSAQKDHQGDPMPMRATRLIIGPSDEAMALQILRNPNEPFTTDNNINTLQMQGATTSYRVSHYKEDDGSWFLIDPSLQDMHFLFRVRPQFGDEQDKGGTLAARYWARQRIMAYFFDQRGIVGSDGTGV
jgi:hypothetical protein